MNTFSIYTCRNIGVAFLDEMIETIENTLPTLKMSWENLAPYTLNNRWRPSLDKNLELIGTGHYTVLKSLNYIRKNKSLVLMNDPEQRFKNIYFHFGLIIDCIKQIARSILLFENKLGIIEFKETKYLKEEVIQKVGEWYDENYSKSYNRLSNDGVAILIPMQPDSDYLSLLATRNKLTIYYQFKNNIQPYRNILIHNPTVDIFVKSGMRGQLVVRKEVLKKSRFLNQIDNTKRSDLMNPVDMVDEDYNECLVVIESVWEIFLEHIKEINGHPDYNNKRNR